MIELTPKLLRQTFPQSMGGLCAVFIEYKTCELIYYDGRRRKFRFNTYHSLLSQFAKLEVQYA